MATSNLPQGTDDFTTSHFPADQTAREEIAWHALCQFDALLDMLRRERGNDGFGDVFLSTLIRLKTLNRVVLSVIGDDDLCETNEMCEIVYGEAKEVAHA